MSQKAKSNWQQAQKKSLSEEIQADVQKLQGELGNIVGELYITPKDQKKRKENEMPGSAPGSPEKSSTSKKSKKEGKKERKHKREDKEGSSPKRTSKKKKKKEEFEEVDSSSDDERTKQPERIKKNDKEGVEAQSKLLELWNKTLEKVDSKSLSVNDSISSIQKKQRGTLKVALSDEQIRFAVERPPRRTESKPELRTPIRDNSEPKLEKISSSVKEITIPYERPEAVKELTPIKEEVSIPKEEKISPKTIKVPKVDEIEDIEEIRSEPAQGNPPMKAEGSPPLPKPTIPTLALPKPPEKAPPAAPAKRKQSIVTIPEENDEFEIKVNPNPVPKPQEEIRKSESKSETPK